MILPVAMLVAGPNLTIDRTATVPTLRPGAVVRLADVVVTAGGKGLNVARAALALRVPAALVAFLPGHTGRAAAALIAEEGVTLHGLAVGGEVRSTSIVLEAGGRATVLNEPGPPLGDGDWLALEAAVEDALPQHGVVVCSGSLPPGAPEEGYALLVGRARDAGRRTVVDAGGAVLRAALDARPDVVTPNLAEAEGVLGGHADEAVEAAPDARPRAEAGSAGSAWLPAPAVAVRNPIGAGDVLTAAVAAALEVGEDVPEAARRGVAAAAASVETPRAGDLDPRRMDELLA